MAQGDDGTEGWGPSNVRALSSPSVPASSIWMGQSFTFDCTRGAVVALPESALPESMLEWGVSSYEWRTMCVQDGPRGGDGISAAQENPSASTFSSPSVSFRTTRFCPETGCSSFDDLIYDERVVLLGLDGFTEEGGDWCHGPDKLQAARTSDTPRRWTTGGQMNREKRALLEWEACIITECPDPLRKGEEAAERVERVRIMSRHDLEKKMRPYEVVMHREKFARSRVAIADDYLNDDLSKQTKLDAKELAVSAGFAGRPRALQSDASIALLPSGAFAAGCIDAGVAHVAAGCRSDDGALCCWTRSYDIASGALLETDYLRKL